MKKNPQNLFSDTRQKKKKGWFSERHYNNKKGDLVHTHLNFPQNNWNAVYRPAAISFPINTITAAHEGINNPAWAGKTNTAMHVLNLNLNLSEINQNLNLAVLFFMRTSLFQGGDRKKNQFQ